MPRPRTRDPQAFTIIELLVVITVIAVLVAMLMPALSIAREGARLAICATQQRQIGIGFGNYMANFGTQYPHTDCANVGPTNSWDMAIGEYMGLNTRKLAANPSFDVYGWQPPAMPSHPMKFVKCPSDPANTRAVVFNHYASSYAMNTGADWFDPELGHGTAAQRNSAGPGNGAPWNPAGGITNAQWRSRKHFKESDIPAPAGVFLIVESNQSGAGGTTRNYIRAGDLFCYWAYPYHYEQAPFTGATGTQNYRNGISNYLYCDGRVAALKSLDNPGYTVSWSAFTDSDSGTLYFFQAHSVNLGGWTIKPND